MPTLEEYLSSRSSATTLEDYLQNRVPFMPLDDYFKKKRELEVKKDEDSRSFLEKAGGVLEQGLVGALGEATLGLMKPEEDYAPQGTAETIANTAGAFGGFLLTPMKIGKGAATIGMKILRKPAMSALEAVVPKAAAQVGRAGAYALKSAGSLAAASAVQDITDPAGMPQRALEGAALGAIFAGAGLAHFPKHPFISQILRQGAGRVAQGVLLGAYPEGYFDKENLANMLWSEALNTWFLKNGMTPAEVLTGKMDKVKQAKWDMINNMFNDAAKAGSAVKTEPKLGPSYYPKGRPDELSIHEIHIPIDTKATPADMELYAEGIRQGRQRPIHVKWDVDEGKYVTMGQDALVQAAQMHQLQKVSRGEASDTRVQVLVMGEKPGVAAKLATPLEIAKGYYGVPVIDEAFISAAEGSRYFIGDVTQLHADTPAGLRMISNEKALGSVKLKPYEVLYKATGTGEGEVLEPVAAGESLRKNLVHKGKYVPGPKQMMRMQNDRAYLEMKKRAILDQPIGAGDEVTYQWGKEQRTGTVTRVSPEEIRLIDPAAQPTGGVRPSDPRFKEAIDQIDATWTTDALIKERQLKRTLTGEERSALRNAELKRNGIDPSLHQEQWESAWIESHGLEQPMPSTPTGEKAISPSDILSVQKHTVFDATDPQAVRHAKDLATIAIAETEMANKDLKNVTLDGKTYSIDKIANAANRKLQIIRRIPMSELPEQYISELTTRMKNLNVALDDPQVLLRAIGGVKERAGGATKLRLMHLPAIEGMLYDMENAPQDVRWNILLNRLRNENDLTHTPLTGERLKAQRESELTYHYYRRRALAEAVANAKKSGQHPLAKLFTLKFAGQWADVRYAAQIIQRNTPLPLYDMVMKIDPGARMRTRYVDIMTTHLLPYSTATPADQAAIKTYFTRVYDGQDTAGVLKTDYQVKYRDAINEMMARIAPDIVRYRHGLWIRNVREPEIDGVQTKVRVFKSQSEKSVYALLERGRELRSLADVSKDPRAKEAYEAWVKDATASGLGLIQAGAYLPEHILNIKSAPIDRYTEAMSIDTMGHGPFEQRTRKAGNVDLEEVVVSEFRSQNLNLQLHNYVNQVGNATFVEPHLRALQEAVDIFKPYLEQARPQSPFRTGTEPKGFSTLDYLNLYASRAKGFPVKIGPLGRLLRGTQAIFFKALAVRPVLWLRNIYQRYQQTPTKSMMFDPRFKGKGYAFDKLPDTVKEWFETKVDEGGEFKQYYLQLESYSKLARAPGLKWLMQAADKVGSIYSASDSANRKAVFNRTWWRSKYYIDGYLKGEVSQEKMENRLGINKMKVAEQGRFRELIEAKDADGASSWIGQWQTENSQWVYRRHGKSLAEMTPEGESFTNLLTWSKSATQQVVHSYERMQDGHLRAQILKGMGNAGPARKAAYRQMTDAALQIGGVMLAGYVGNAILATISNTHKAKYSSYGVDMFTWEFGGVTFSILKDFSTAMAELVSSAEGTPSEQKTAMGNTLKMLDNVVIRQLLPFSKQALAVVESITGRSYISPLYEAGTKLMTGTSVQETKVKRTMIESFIHGILITDPNKGRDVREFTYKKMLEMEEWAATEKNPVFKAYAKGRFEYMKYLNDLFMRYEPIEVYKNYIKKKDERGIPDAESYFEKLRYEYDHKQALNERKSEMGY